MPFTNYHLGTSLLIGYLLRRKINWPTLILSSIIIDLEPLIVIVIGLNYPLHGILHTFLASIFVGSSIGFILYLIRGKVVLYMKDLALMEERDSLKSFILAGIIGWASHILLDSPLYPEIKPFYPLNFNPLFHYEPPQILFHTYTLLFLAGVLVYPTHLYKTLRGESMVAAEISVGLVSIGLGAITIPTDILCHIGFTFIIAGILTLAHGLKRLIPQLSRRIQSSSIMLATAASLTYLTSPPILRLTLEQYISRLYILGFPTILISSYILFLTALVMVWPAVRLLKRNLNDHTLSLSINLLILGLILAPLLIPLLITTLTYIIIVIKIPHKLKNLTTTNQLPPHKTFLATPILYL